MSEIAGKISYVTKVDVEITTEMIDDLMVTALEGGSNHWLSSVSVIAPFRGECSSEHLANGGALYVYNDERQRFYLNRDALLSGFEMYCEERCLNPIEVYETHDAAAADSILQYALFGTEVYE